MTDTDIPALVDDFGTAERELMNHFKAADIQVYTHEDGWMLRLEFAGFSTFEEAFERIEEVADELRELNETGRVGSGVANEGEFDPHEDEELDERPSGWVSAEFE